jgi:hypothetical protein
MNMHWDKQELGLPKLSPGRRWSILVDTALEDSFMETECIPDDQHVIEVEPRSIKILGTVTSDKPIRRKRAAGKKSSKVSKKANDSKGAVKPLSEEDETHEKI